MCDLSLLPARLERCRLDDELLAKGYENFPAADRARLKTTQTLLMSLFAECPDREVLRQESSVQGISRTETRVPAPWALFLLPGEFADAPRLTSMLMAARLGNVPLLAVAFLTRTPETLAPGILSALELCGIEHAFAMPQTEAETLMRLMASHGRGRLIGPTLPEQLTGMARTLGVVTHEIPFRPHVAVDPALPPEARETISRLLPGVQLCPLPLKNRDCTPPPDLVFHAGNPSFVAGVQLDETLAGCWVETELTPAFFLNVSLSLSLR